jgi:hypothetical protein
MNMQAFSVRNFTFAGKSASLMCTIVNKGRLARFMKKYFVQETLGEWFVWS